MGEDVERMADMRNLTERKLLVDLPIRMTIISKRILNKYCMSVYS
jgi:hypothetical protein